MESKKSIQKVKESKTLMIDCNNTQIYVRNSYEIKKSSLTVFKQIEKGLTYAVQNGIKINNIVYESR